jgi:2-(1,2-epoxy-1,2-dihydrophenyl)acetyl-CoA isomerase
MAEVELTVEDGVATVMLNRPHRKNATTPELWRQLGEHVGQVAVDTSIRAVVLTGAGEAFCAGADLGESFPANQVEARARVARCHQIIGGLYNMEKPVIAAIRGPAVGSGFSMALCCDFIITSDTARFSYAFSRLGLVGDAGALFLLQRTVGVRAAKELAYTSRFVGAEEALRLGISFRNVPDDELGPTVDKLATELAAAPTYALGITKRLLQRNWGVLEDFLPEELLTVPLMSTTADAAEGIAAMREKRPPRFEGH